MSDAGMSDAGSHVTIIIPCRNEGEYIGKCLDSIVANDYPKDRLEVFVVDGRSEDKTREIIQKYAKQNSYIKLLNNDKKITPAALNIGIKHAKGEVIMRMDVHVTYEKDYISKSVKCLYEYAVDNVGGVCRITPGGNSPISKGIALVLSHPFGVGNSYFRTGLKEPKLVDTVPFGCYRKEAFEKIGLFNENLIRNQDIEFNLRFRRTGGKILLVPDIVSYYYARSNLKASFKQSFWNGYWVIYSSKFSKLAFSWRHLVPFAFVMSVMGSLSLAFFWRHFFYLFLSIICVYLAANIFFSFKISLKNGLRLFPSVIISFLTLHVSYGLGSLWGLIRFFSSRKRQECKD